MKTSAIDLAKRGFPVFPCIARGKKPITKTGFKEASTDPEQIQTWWTKYRGANLAIATGGGFFVLDIDGPTGKGTLAKLEAQHGLLPPTPTVQTANGLHYYFKTQDGQEIRNKQSFQPGLDIRGDGGYVIGPPSIHPTGHEYAWLEGLNLADLELAEAPAWLLEMIVQSKLTPAKAPPARPSAEVNNTQRASKYLANMPAAVQGQGGHNQLFAAATAVRHGFCLSVDEARDLLTREFNPRCTPPWNLADATEAKDFYRKIDEAQAQPHNQPRGWLLNAPPVGKETRRDTSERKTTRKPVLKCLADVEPEEIRWLWPGKIPMGKLTLLASDPGCGKSTLTMDIAARISTGKPWPIKPHEAAPAGHTILLSAEDDAGDTIRPRLDAAKADVSKIHILEAIRSVDMETGEEYERGYSLQNDLPVLESVIKQLGDVRLVIIDPVSAYMGTTDSHKNAEVRSVLRPLGDLAAKYGVAVLCISHLNKSQKSSAMYRTLGSVGFVAAARSVFCVVRDKEDKTRRLILPVKNNISPDTKGMAYQVMPCPENPAVGMIAWETEPITDDVNDAMSDTDAWQQEDKETRKLGDEVLLEALRDGPKTSKELDEIARELGLTKKQLRTAKARIGAKPDKKGFSVGGQWLWYLPEKTTEKAT